MMAICPAHIKSDAAKLREWLDTQYDSIVEMLQSMAPDSDYVHFDDINESSDSSQEDVEAFFDSFYVVIHKRLIVPPK